MGASGVESQLPFVSNAGPRDQQPRPSEAQECYLRIPVSVNGRATCPSQKPGSHSLPITTHIQVYPVHSSVRVNALVQVLLSSLEMQGPKELVSLPLVS